MSNMLLPLTASSAIACALVSGVFLTFSDFVMRSLNKTEVSGGIEAMQHINREVFRTLFMVLLVGMSAMSPVLMWMGWTLSDGPARQFILFGGAIYTIAVFAVTLLGNVPMNVRLDRLDKSTWEAESYWSKFYPRWTWLNHIRTVGAAASAICFLLASLTLVAS
ncbi:MAG: DUF1772 domain-containing protein [Hyphomonas sp.]|nr:DUF1772 domain-containing protein [Hyphomonas sp.]